MGLSQINPLFLDSTKPIGDKVVTNVELLAVTLRDGESVYFEVSDHFGFVQRFIMQKYKKRKILLLDKNIFYTLARKSINQQSKFIKLNN